MTEHLPECAAYHPSGDGFDVCICDRLAQAEARTADAIRDRIAQYADSLDSNRTRSVALTCAGLATVAGLR